MSRIANYPVIVPDKVEVTVHPDQISVKGPLGTLTQKISQREQQAAAHVRKPHEAGAVC